MNETEHTLFARIKPGTTFITPNRRLSATLHQRYQQYQLSSQHTFWETPDILPIHSWFERLWTHLTSQFFSSSPLLLNVIQEQLLWEKMVLASKESEQLLQISETAEALQSAWSLLNNGKSPLTR